MSGRISAGDVIASPDGACASSQRRGARHVSVTPTMDESGLVKLNLHPNDWHHPDDRARYLDALAPEMIAGDPISFAELERIVHVLLQSGMYVEILDQAGEPLPPGERGEIALRGGFNFCLPLLRYRTGDHAALDRVGPDLALIGLSGRPPVSYRTSSGEWINNIEIAHALRHLPLVQYALHQDVAGDLVFVFQGSGVSADTVSSALKSLFGTQQRLNVTGPVNFDAKLVQYASDLAGAEL